MSINYNEWGSPLSSVTGYDLRYRDVVNCPRCGEEHETLFFQDFLGVPTPYAQWTLCPTTQQPIITLTQVEFIPEGGRLVHVTSGPFRAWLRLLWAVLCMRFRNETRSRRGTFRSRRRERGDHAAANSIG